MSRKAYTLQEREDLKAKLHQIGLDIYLRQGVQNVKLPEILKTAGISKPFFYTFYPSLGDLIMSIIDEQRLYILNLFDQIQSDERLDWKGKIEVFLNKLLHHKEHRVFILSPEDEVWVYHRLSKESYDHFQNTQISFYTQLLNLWEIPLSALPPQVFGNYLLSLIIIRNNAPTSLPFLFHDYLDDTASLQIKLFIDYLETLHSASVHQ